MARPHKYRFTRGVGQMVDSLPAMVRLLDWCQEMDDGHSSPCWVWQGHCDQDGYGEIKFRGKKCRAARVSYAAFVGQIKDGNDIDHECTNRACINPRHLVQVDPFTNRVVLRDERKKAAEMEAAPF